MAEPLKNKRFSFHPDGSIDYQKDGGYIDSEDVQMAVEHLKQQLKELQEERAGWMEYHEKEEPPCRCWAIEDDECRCIDRFGGQVAILKRIQEMVDEAFPDVVEKEKGPLGVEIPDEPTKTRRVG